MLVGGRSLVASSAAIARHGPSLRVVAQCWSVLLDCTLHRRSFAQDLFHRLPGHLNRLQLLDTSLTLWGTWLDVFKRHNGDLWVRLCCCKDTAQLEVADMRLVDHAIVNVGAGHRRLRDLTFKSEGLSSSRRPTTRLIRLLAGNKNFLRRRKELAR